MNYLTLIILLLLLFGCGGGSSSEETNSSIPLTITFNNLKEDSYSYDNQSISIGSNYSGCVFEILNNDLLHLSSSDGVNFSFRNPIIYEGDLTVSLTVKQVSSNCPSKTIYKDFLVQKYPTQFSVIPSNQNDLKTAYYQVNDIGFGGLEITDRYTATICYPTANDCQTFTNELFGQDAHNMTTGDFNGDGYEDFVVAWALFPHTIEPSQKINAPINIYLNDGNGRFIEDTSIYENGIPPKHPFAYRIVVNDFNDDGIDDIFSGSMGIQYRSQDYSQNFIDPYPHLLLLSNPSGKLIDSSSQIEDQNNGDGQMCNFAHDASSGDPDGDGDIDIFACNILNVNDGQGNFTIHNYINLNWQISNGYGNPMASLMADLNNDGYDDIIFWNFDNRNLNINPEEGFILLSDNSPNISSWSKIVLPTGPFGINHNKYNHAASGDLNNDGYIDVVVAVTRDQPYYEGAYLQVLINTGEGILEDKTSVQFNNQPRENIHHGEGNVYLRDMNSDGTLDIIHSTRDFHSGLHGAHIALNDGLGNFTSVEENRLPDRPDSCCNDDDVLMKGLPINADNEACMDLISATDVGWGNWQIQTENYLFTLINTNCEF
tara:strand:- start:556 stop:2358 length:1803 start_codon:yes stop_codon:yes gene_type:complete